MPFCFRFRRQQPFLLALLLLISFDALAWNAAGHRLSAVIAWEQMSPATRQRVDRLLNLHPGHRDWISALTRGRGEGHPDTPSPLAVFAEASTWADDIRRDPRYSDRPASDNGGNDWLRHRDRHFVNWPIDRGASASRGGRLDVELRRFVALLADRSQPPVVHADALVWLIHLVADAHQPLHVASWPLADGGFDDGGLRFNLRDDANPRFSETSLHAWWDDLPGPPWLRGKRLMERTAILSRAFPAQEISQKTIGDWLNESLELARKSVRPSSAESDQAWLLTPEYRAQAKETSHRRVVEAGVRLGRLLESLLND